MTSAPDPARRPDPTGLPPSWRDHLDRPVDRPEPPGRDDVPFYAAMMAFQAGDYDRNAFAMGTTAEVAALRRLLDLGEGTRVLDVGCATGRHLRALATDPGCVGVGVDVSVALVEVARAEVRRAMLDGLTFEVGDARALLDVAPVAEVVADGGFDVVWSLCQGGLGTDPTGDRDVLAGMAAAVRPGGRLALTAFHALFAARHLVEGDAFDPVRGVHHQRTELRGPDHARRWFDLWTTAWTVRELTSAVAELGLVVESVAGCEPGRFDGRGVALDDPELLLVARRP